jgi:predicted ATP-dependent endonuclease of OLD family
MYKRGEDVMKLVKVDFNAFKSLVNMKLDVNHNCIGFVGINESGKSNVLSAIRVLGGERKLIEADTPKMEKTNPFISFVFELNDDEFSLLQTKCNNLFKQYIPEFEEELLTNKTIKYNVVYNRQENNEYRYFDIPEIKIKDNLMILQSEKYISKYQIKTKDGFKELDNCWFITDTDFQLHLGLEKVIEKLKKSKELLDQKENALNKSSKTEDDEIENDESSNENETEKDVVDNEEEISSNDVLDLRSEISELKEYIETIADETKDYKVPRVINEIEKRNTLLDFTIKNEMTNKTSLNEELKKLKTVPTPTSTQLERITELEGLIKKADNIISTNKNKIDENKSTSALLKESISEKFTNKKEVFVKFISDKLEDDLTSLLPRVVFWEYDEKYLQESRINLEELLQQKDFANISRPLVNIFRISFGIKSFDDIKAKIKEAQRDGNERSRISDQLTESVNNFLKNIWIDYDQKIKITIEENELRVAIFDPGKKHASYYSLIERSQGCRTFISFLLTIGAEANERVLKNTILLLDEPETHLHPSGVKFMLKELIKISEAENNIVFYATHSMFMIDRNNFDRHIIIKKDNEISKLTYAFSDRIGSFMQEEVLYNALTIELCEFDTVGNINFVFEGYGDTILFKTIYKLLSESKKTIPFLFDECVFHHGGGCDNIMKYLKHRPIRLKTKWIFILDSDKPAEKLKKFIESEYKDYIKNDVFVFQYEYNGINNSEFEDLLPDDIKMKSYNNVLLSENKDTINENTYSSLTKDISSFSEQFKEICKKLNLVDSNIKGVFKENLNQELENDIRDINENEFNKKYNNYYKWFEGIIKSCKKDNVQQESS